MTRCVPGPSSCTPAHCCTELHSPICDRLPEQAEVRVCVYVYMCVCVCTCLHAHSALSASQERALRGLLFINREVCSSTPHHQRQADNTFPPSAIPGADREGAVGVSEESRPDSSALKLWEPP